jgi:hypothetical protein
MGDDPSSGGYKREILTGLSRSKVGEYEDTTLWPSPFSLEVPVRIASEEIVIVYDGHRPYLEDASGYRMPAAFEALIRRPGIPLCQLSIEITPTGGPVCRRLTLADERLTAGGIRVPFRQLIKDTMRLVGVRPRDMDPSEYDPEDFMRALARPEPGKRLSDEWLERVAEVYRDALSHDLPPTDTVANELHCSRSTAGRWVMEARERGKLGKAIPGVAGERPEQKEE